MVWTRGQRKRRGFSLIELMVGLVMVTILMGLGFSGLRKAQVSGGSRGLATAVAAELRLAREIAIAKGSPVAVALPNGVSRSLYLIEGATEPAITRSVDYSGDYPRAGLCVVTYPGPAFVQNADMPGAKTSSWKAQMAGWLPGAGKEDFVFMFTPNGSVVSNDLPAAEGSYRLVVSGTGLQASRTGAPSGAGHVDGNDGVYYQLDGANEPWTISISQGGGVEVSSGVLGASSSHFAAAASGAAPDAPLLELDYVPEPPEIFFSRVTPPAEEVDGQQVHILDKGEYLTLEVFAHSTDGRPLFAGWVDNPVTKAGQENFKGRFSVPNGEPERMEFYPEYDVREDGSPVERNVWRSVWTWTPPAVAEPGDRYALTVDVKDATLTHQAEIPTLPPVDVSPPGEIVFERMDGNGFWHLFTMWADGSRMTRLTSGERHHRFASATADGKTIAYELGGDEVWVMNVDGTGAVKIADNAWCPTISPVGNSIAYLDANNQDLVVQRLTSTAGASVRRPSRATQLAGVPVTPGIHSWSTRLAYSPDGDWVYYTDKDGEWVNGVNIRCTGDSISIVGESIPGSRIPNCELGRDPAIGGIFVGRGGEVFYHADQPDPFLAMYPTTNGQLGASTTFRFSAGDNEAHPSISPNQDLLLFCFRQGADWQIRRVAKATWTDVGSFETVVASGLNLRPAWIRQASRF